jgi:hypothetical protein
MDRLFHVDQASGDEPAGGAAIGEARDRAHLPRPWRRPPRGGRLRGDPRLPRDHGRRRLGADHAALPALRRRGAGRGGRFRPRRGPLPGRHRSASRRWDAPRTGRRWPCATSFCSSASAGRRAGCAQPGRYLVVAAIAAALIALIAWALLRLEGAAERRPHAPRAGGRSPVGEPELVRNRIKAISQHHRNIC